MLWRQKQVMHIPSVCFLSCSSFARVSTYSVPSTGTWKARHATPASVRWPITCSDSHWTQSGKVGLSGYHISCLLRYQWTSTVVKDKIPLFGFWSHCKPVCLENLKYRNNFKICDCPCQTLSFPYLASVLTDLKIETRLWPCREDTRTEMKEGQHLRLAST